MEDGQDKTLSDFRRLYRELEKDGDGVPRHDKTYRNERIETMYRIGHNMKGFRDKVKVNKNHGKVARTRVIKDIEAQIEKDKDERKKKIQLQKAMKQNDEFNKMIREMGQNVLVKGKKIDDKFIDKVSKLMDIPRTTNSEKVAKKQKITAQIKEMVTMSRSRADMMPTSMIESRGGGGASNAGSGSSISGSSSSSMSAQSTIPEGPHRSFLPRIIPTRARALHILDKNYTTSTWSQKERETMKEIYWDMKRPPKKVKSLWKQYYNNFADKFLEFHPKRIHSEVVEKIQHLITTRAFKEDGEKEYWNNHKKQESIQMSALPQTQRFGSLTTYQY